MAMISNEQVRRVYALGSAAGILESGNKDDNLHALVKRVTGRSSVKDMTYPEFLRVEKELLPMLQGKHRAPAPPPPPKPAAAPGMMNAAQQKLAWKLVYRLRDMDENRSRATVGERMVGAIKKALNVDADIKEPFKWISAGAGGMLIEELKRYVRSAEARARKKGVV